MILYFGMYLLIWGKAANVQFMPECIRYIFHRVSNRDCVTWLSYSLVLLSVHYILFLQSLERFFSYMFRWHACSKTCCLSLPALPLSKMWRLNIVEAMGHFWGRLEHHFTMQLKRCVVEQMCMLLWNLKFSLLYINNDYALLFQGACEIEPGNASKSLLWWS